jgi:hypothetical protein
MADPRRASSKMLDRAGFDPNYDPVLEQRRATGARRQEVQRKVYGEGGKPFLFGTGGLFGMPAATRHAEAREEELMAAIPDIGAEPAGPPTASIRRGVAPDAPDPGAPLQPTGAGRTVGQASGRYGRRSATIPEIGEGYNDVTARAGVAARAQQPREAGPIDPLSLSASGIESDMGAQELLNQRYAQNLQSIDLADPYARAREAQREASSLAAEQEGLGLVPEDEAPDTSIYSEGGTYKNRRTPRLTGKEYKGELSKTRAGELAIARGAVPEQMKAQAGEARRRAFYDQATREIDMDANAQAQQLQQTHKGDQLELMMQQLKKAAGEAKRKALIDSFALDARFNVKSDPMGLP